jgi:hypothetical protein
MSRLIATAVRGDAARFAALDRALTYARAAGDVVHLVHAYEPLALTGSVGQRCLRPTSKRERQPLKYVTWRRTTRPRPADLDAEDALNSADRVGACRHALPSPWDSAETRPSRAIWWHGKPCMTTPRQC